MRAALALALLLAAGPAPAQEAAPNVRIGDAGTPPGTPARPMRPGELRPLASCPLVPMDLRGIQDKPEIEAFMAARVQESFALNGAVDWDCLVLRFDATLGERTSVVAYRRDNGEEGDTYRFNLDRRSLFRWFWPVPGGSNGVFTAIITVQDDGQVFVIARGGDRVWIPLD